MGNSVLIHGTTGHVSYVGRGTRVLGQESGIEQGTTYSPRCLGAGDSEPAQPYPVFWHGTIVSHPQCHLTGLYLSFNFFPSFLHPGTSLEVHKLT